MVAKTQKSTVVLAAENKTGRAFKAAGQSADSLAKKYTGISAASGGVALAVAAAVAATAVFTKRAIEAADQIAKTADGIGITTDALQEYRFAAELAGVETAIIDGAFQTFGKRLGELQTGMGTLTTFLTKFDNTLKENITTADSSEQALELIFEAMSKIEDQSQRAAFASAAFGRTAGVRMVNLVRDGSDSLKAMRQEAQDLGLVLDNELLRGAESANDALARTSRIVGVNFQKLLLTLAPTIEEFGEAFGRAAPSIAKATEELVAFFGGIELLGIEGLRRELADLEKQLVTLSSPRNLERATRLDPTGENRKAIIAEIATLKELIAARELAAENRKTLLDDQDSSNESRSQQEVDAAKRVLAEIATARARADEDEETLAQIRLDRRLAAIDKVKLSEEEALQAKADAEELFEQERDERRREREEERKEEELEKREQDLQELIDFQTAGQDLIESANANHVANLVQAAVASQGAITRAWQSGLQGRLALTSQILGTIATLQDSKSKKAFKIGKAAAIAKATIDTFVAANASYSALAGIPIVGPALGAAAAAAAIVAGIINVKKIASQKFEGGGSSGGGGGGGFSAGGGGGTAVAAPDLPAQADVVPAAPARTVTLVIDSDRELFSRQDIRDLMELINEEAADGTTFNVAS